MEVKKITKKAIEFEQEFKKYTFTAIAAAFGFVMALTWNEAIKATVLKIIDALGITGEGYIFQIIAAIIITVICILGIIYASRLAGNK